MRAKEAQSVKCGGCYFTNAYLCGMSNVSCGLLVSFAALFSLKIFSALAGFFALILLLMHLGANF